MGLPADFIRSETQNTDVLSPPLNSCPSFSPCVSAAFSNPEHLLSAGGRHQDGSGALRGRDGLCQRRVVRCGAG